MESYLVSRVGAAGEEKPLAWRLSQLCIARGTPQARPCPACKLSQSSSVPMLSVVGSPPQACLPQPAHRRCWGQRTPASLALPASAPVGSMAARLNPCGGHLSSLSGQRGVPPQLGLTSATRPATFGSPGFAHSGPVCLVASLVLRAWARTSGSMSASLGAVRFCLHGSGTLNTPDTSALAPHARFPKSRYGGCLDGNPDT